MNPVLAAMHRADLIESVHTGRLVLLNPDGSIDKSWGDIEQLIYPRSAIKCVQAAVGVEMGSRVSGPTMALAASSHSGAPMHIQGVIGILSEAGLTVDDLRCPPDWPLGPKEHQELLRSHGQKEPVVMNCSGKHSSWLNACVHSGMDTSTYLDVAHPIQVQIKKRIEELAHEEITISSVDGCGAPLHAMTLTGLARAVQGCVVAESGTSERLVIDAVRTHPEMASGVGRDVAQFMQAVSGAYAKEGAEGVQVVALADGRAMALKIDDGNMRARAMITARVFEIWGVANVETEKLISTEVLGGGRSVGKFKATF
jgi:L-asparaginase II